MKTFTRLFNLFICAAIANTAFAQTDLSVTGLTTLATATGQISPSSPTFLRLEFENSGVDVIPSGATALVFFLNGTDTIQTINGVFDGNIAVGGVVTATSDPFTLPPTPANITLCAGIIMTSVAETDSTNNLICLPFTVSTAAQVDLKANSLSIVAPTNIDGFNIDNGQNDVPKFTELSAEFENAGNVIYPVGYQIAYKIGLAGDSINVIGTLASELLPGGTTTRTINNPALIPAMPQDSGTYDICVVIKEDDENSANDKACASFTIVDAFDVNNPDNWPLGIENTTDAGVQVFVSNGKLNVAGVQGSTTIQVTDISGKVVANETINRDSSLTINSVTGVYIVTTKDANGNVEITKVVL
jgi:hypothetical protein